MYDFSKFAKAVYDNFVEMSKNELYQTEHENIFDFYLSSFPNGTNPIYKTKTEYDCSTCKHFIKNVGGLVCIKNNKKITVWDNLNIDYPYAQVAEKMSEFVKSLSIKNVFRTSESKFGSEYNYDLQRNKYYHFYCNIDKKHQAKDVGEVLNNFSTAYNVFKRGLLEFNREHFEEILEMIKTNQIYRGQEHSYAISDFMQLLINSKKKNVNLENFIWENIKNPNCRFRNTAIGSLFVDLAEGKDLEEAVKSFESKVAPANYKRPAAIVSQKMVENAIQTLTDLNLGAAIYRRYAKISDISVNNVLFVDNDYKRQMKDGISALLSDVIKKEKPNLEHAKLISADDFVSNVLPTTNSLELYLENSHLGNFVSLTTSDNDANIFKWNNNFAWSYDGDVTDSVKERVKKAGGNINCELRFSLSWFNTDDLDLHCDSPFGPIYYADKKGILDVDMNAGFGLCTNPVENLAFTKVKLKNGKYSVFVNQFNRRNNSDFGFEIEYEYEGVIKNYNYPLRLNNKQQVECFTFTVDNGKVKNITPSKSLKFSDRQVEKWSLKTGELIGVSSVMFSPNHWNGEKVGAKHLIFGLKGCLNPEKTRGIYNEFLRNDLEKHRKVFEVLGAKTKCVYSEEQVSGVGFTAARNDSVKVVVNGRNCYNVTF